MDFVVIRCAKKIDRKERKKRERERERDFFDLLIIEQQRTIFCSVHRMFLFIIIIVENDMQKNCQFYFHLYHNDML